MPLPYFTTLLGFILFSTLDSMYKQENRTIVVDDGEICVCTVSPMPTVGKDPEFPVMVHFHSGGVIFLSTLLRHGRGA